MFNVWGHIGYTTVAHYTLLGELYTFTNCKNSMVPGESPLHRSHGGSALATQTSLVLADGFH